MTERLDILVVGAGIHGAGIAQAAAAAGYDVLLLEKDRPASGTSSRSSKLIHGGLRYLETASFALVRESLRERNLLLKLAPELVRPVAFHIPVYLKTARRPWQVRAGLTLYRILEGIGSGGGFDTVAREDWDRLDGIRTDGLLQVFRYTDAATDDAALTRAVIGSARDLGADAVYPAGMIEAVKEDGGYRVEYECGGSRRTVRSRVLVNAAGPWVGQVVDSIRPKPAALEIDLIQGAHILLADRLERGVYYTEAPSDRRVVLIIPWEGGTMVGTTETPFTGDPDRVEPMPEEISYLREVFRFYFPGKEDRVTGAFAGLRVLSRGWGLPFHRSREVVLATDGARPPGLVTVYGGKLTTYRSTALKVLRLLRRSLPRKERRASTAEIPLSDPGPATPPPSPPAIAGNGPPARNPGGD